jgi:hypothetical protein
MKITLLQYLRTENTPFSKIKTYIFGKARNCIYHSSNITKIMIFIMYVSFSTNQFLSKIGAFIILNFV